MTITQLAILSEEYNHHPYYFIERLDRSQNLLFDSTLNTRVATGYQTVKELLAKQTIFSAEPLAVRAEPVMRGKALAQMQGDEHKMKRSLIARHITGTMLHNYYQQHLQALCDRILAQLSPRPAFDLLADFGKEYALLSTFTILGIGQEDLDFYHRNLQRIVKFATGFNLSAAEQQISLAASAEMEQALLQLIAKKRAKPGGDLLSFILAEGIKDDSKKLSDAEIVSLSLNILLASSEPVDKVLSACIYHLYRHPDALAGLTGGAIKASDILQETLRLTPFVHLIPRLATARYVTQQGDVIEQGETIYMLLPAANRDPAIFPAPHLFNPLRAYKGHLSYGSGVHTCIGAQFASLQLTIALTHFAALLSQYEEKDPVVFTGVYTRGMTSYVLKKRNDDA